MNENWAKGTRSRTAAEVRKRESQRIFFFFLRESRFYATVVQTQPRAHARTHTHTHTHALEKVLLSTDGSGAAGGLKEFITEHAIASSVRKMMMRVLLNIKVLSMIPRSKTLQFDI